MGQNAWCRSYEIETVSLAGGKTEITECGGEHSLPGKENPLHSGCVQGGLQVPVWYGYLSQPVYDLPGPLPVIMLNCETWQVRILLQNRGSGLIMG